MTGGTRPCSGGPCFSEATLANAPAKLPRNIRSLFRVDHVTSPSTLPPERKGNHVGSLPTPPRRAKPTKRVAQQVLSDGRHSLDTDPGRAIAHRRRRAIPALLVLVPSAHQHVPGVTGFLLKL